MANGLGGYASGTLVGVSTRRYHGLLVAALAPPVERTVLVAGAVEWARYAGKSYALATQEYGDGTIDPDGYRHLQSFALDGMLPVWTFALADALLERRVWMEYGANVTYLSYRLLRATGQVDLEIRPFVTCRDFHSLSPIAGWEPDRSVETAMRRITLRLPLASQRRRFLRLEAEDGHFTPDGVWYWNFRHRAETDRGLDDRSDLYAPGVFRASLSPGARYTLTLAAEAGPAIPAEAALAAARQRQADLLRRAGAAHDEPFIQQLVLAADQFVVVRGSPLEVRSPTPTTPAGTAAGVAESSDPGSRPPDPGRSKTVIAGYPWFADWGRDTMIALPGLTLAVGRRVDAAGILRTFAVHVRDGLLPNNFPDRAEDDPGYNTVDAALWYVLAVGAYHAATGDGALVEDVLPALQQIVARYTGGTRYGIGVDPADGLLRAGEPGTQLTWMDARVDGRPVTPRVGKPVEINALWYNALRTLAALLAARDAPEAANLEERAARVHESFRSRFRRPDLDHLADVVDGPDGDDCRLRPNQIFAISLPYPLLEGEAARRVVEAVGRALLTSYGLRSLSPDDPDYHGTYAGDRVRRDAAYHQGSVWTWLLGPYAAAHYRVYGDRNAALDLLRPIADHLRDAGLGTVSEIFDGDPPHPPRGAIAQAWGVAEVLRVWRALSPAIHPG